MAAAPESETLARIAAFRWAMQDRMATRTEPFGWGTALFNASFPRSYINFLRVERPDDRLTADRLAGECDRLLGGAGIGHRFARVDDEATGARVAGPLADIGWSEDRLVVMAVRRGPDRPAGQGVARESTWDEVRAAKETWIRRDLPGADEDRVGRVIGRLRALSGATSLRHFAAFAGGEAVSIADLYSDGHTAQIEDVWTHEDHRERGLARATVLTAAATALTHGHDLVFLLADDAGWPQHLYDRLGFDRIGRVYEFWREADG